MTTTESQDLLYPTGYYRLADYCPHDIGSDDEEPDDGIHVGEENEGLLICLESPMQPPKNEPVSKGYSEVEGVAGRVSALKCDTCRTVVDMADGNLRWMQKHLDSHKS